MYSTQQSGSDRTISHIPTTEPRPALPLLVAIAGDDCTAPVVRVAEALSARRGAEPSLLYVMELTPVATMDGGIGSAVLMQPLLDPLQRAEDEESLRASCHVDAGVSATWPLAIELGNAASAIVTHAQHLSAQLIVMGLHRHGPIDHLLAEDTVRAVIAMGTTPVLAARPDLTGLPETIVVAMDFSIASLRAARLARQILADNGTLHLVFVETVDGIMINESEQGRRLLESEGVAPAFQQVRAILDPAPGMTVVCTKRYGNPIDELKAACAEVKADVLAIGSQRHPFLKRLFAGTVTRAMLSDGRWSMLVTPPVARSVRHDAQW